MKKIGVMLLTLLLSIGFTGRAMAFTVNSSPVSANMWMSYAGGSSTDTFTLKLNAFNPAGANKCSSAQLTIFFVGSDNPFDSYSFAGVSENNKNTVFQVSDIMPMIIPISQDGLIRLNSTGQLTFTLTRYCGDFTFKTAMLTATTSPAPVSIPGAFWLFGSASIGFLIMKRKLVTI